MDNVTRRRSLGLDRSDEPSLPADDPPSPEGLGPVVAAAAPEWVIRLTRVSHTAHAQTEFYVYRLRRWVESNRELTLRLTAHSIILVAITATLGLSHVRLSDLRLPALSAPQANRVGATWTDSEAKPSDSESFLQRPMVPRTASAVNVRVTGTDSISLAPREDLFALPTRVSPAVKPPPEAVADTPTLDSLVQTYTAANGDTLLGIATQFDISLEALVTANPFLEGSLTTIFHPGDEFLIPPPGGILHIVSEGDTLQSIATKYQTSVEDILSYAPNRLKADSGLKPDQRVFVPEGSVDLPRPAPQPAPRTNTLAGVLQPRPATASAPVAAAKPAVPAPAAPAPAPKPAAVTQPTVGTGTLRTPLYGYVVTQNFWAYHNGVDLAAPIGTPVYAADAGRVIWSGWDNTGYGYMVLIDHGNGYRTRYGHLSWIFPNYGDYVGKGEQIGKVGSTGRSTGPHLHFEVIVNGIARNPFNYIR